MTITAAITFKFTKVVIVKFRPIVIILDEFPAILAAIKLLAALAIRLLAVPATKRLVAMEEVVAPPATANVALSVQAYSHSCDY